MKDFKILTQIDTFIKGQDTIDITKECINRAKILGFPILLTSHSNIPDVLKEMVDYVEIDLCNPLLEDTNGVSFLRHASGDFETMIKLHNPDPHAPACLTSIINGSRFCKKKEFDYFLRIEFDAILKYEFIEDIRGLVVSSANTNGLIFSNFGEWVDGKFMFFNADVYSKCFNVSITDSSEYLKFVEKRGVPNKDWRHLQVAQYHILKNNFILQNMIIAPCNFLEKCLDKEFIKIREKEVGIFRPAMVIGSEGKKFATIAHGFARSIPFEFQIFHNGVLVQKVEQFFSEGIVTFKIFEVVPGTMHKIVYTNPITKESEQWHFTSSKDLEEFAYIDLK